MNVRFVVGLIISIVVIICTAAGVATLAAVMMMTDQEQDSTEVADEITLNINCFDDNNCESKIGRLAIDFYDCCTEKLAFSYQNLTTNTCIICPVSRQTSVVGDPHFIVPLESGKLLCYSIQGYAGLAFNLIHSESIIINAQFVDTVGDTSEATWIGKLAVISQHVHKTQTVIFDSTNRDVIIFGYGKMKATVIKSIIFYECGKIKYIQGAKEQEGNPTVHVQYVKEQASFDIEFHKDHLDVQWDLQYDKLHELGGLIGQFIKPGIDIDTQREILIFSDGRLPLPVIRNSYMTIDDNRQCWRAANHGNQGEGLIQGKILDYLVPHILEYKKKYLKPFIKW